jgi:hypothetical protein
MHSLPATQGQRWVAFKNCYELRKAYSFLKSAPSLESLSCKR